MKWYEKQKQLFAQKNESEDAPAKEEALSSIYEEVIHEDDSVLEEQVFEKQTSKEDLYDEKPFDSEQYDKILDDPTSSFVPVEQFHETTQTTEIGTTTISKGTRIVGNIETDDNLIIRGTIKGNIICNANLSVYGEVEGSIQCASAYFDEALITGDVTVNDNAKLTSTSTINGNLEANELVNGGRIKGNATVNEGIHFSSTSAIVGDISAKDIDIERGAVVQGNINIRQDVYFEN